METNDSQSPHAQPAQPEPARRIVIVGGVAGGMSAAARARRQDEHAQIIVLEQSAYVSFANCGLPYQLAGEIARRDDLLLHTPDSLAAALALDVRVGSRVTAIDREARTVTVRTADEEYPLGYDALLLAPGAVAVRPPIEGLDLSAVHSLRTIPDLDGLRARVDRLVAERPGAGRAVVVGAGFIGLEAVEALVTRGLHVDLVELADHVLPPLDAELAPLLADELVEHGVGLHLGVSARSVAASGEGSDAPVTVTLSDGTVIAADVVVVNVGVRPASDLARDAGLELGTAGAIRVDGDQRTSDPHIWAVGDAVEVTHAVTGVVGPVPLAGPANRQGRRAADSMLGRRTTPQAAVLGTAIVRVFGLTAAVTGASQATLARAGIAHEVVRIHPGHHAGYYPGAEQVHLVASFAPDGRLLGAQGVGRAGVDKRIDVLATALRAGMTADDLAELELAYAPPFGSAKDAVNMLGFVAQNVLDGVLPQWHPADLDAARADTLVLDVRSVAEYDRGHLPEALNIPHTQLRDRLDEVREAAAGRVVSVHCQSGVRSYIATRVLLAAGLDARNLSGGWLTLRAARPDLSALARTTPRTQEEVLV
ncbi:FAD-dependent oxidoreductase [Cellulomonas soli]|uniref:FAD-dependent oxidoreductase n=1 Tax=Cellulomonas soli TaxID=931535 RepID=UPI0017A0F10A|nr:FAD-dependent oxidoreductase [Cellulomonas soli]NYI60510.1 NADPH-dependent 2,4-dienoyl-CoA reductase/sulfur reductase-like enzyme/rhodanese-related sulfurtransferase [Cellulomonas soli]